MRIGVLSDTHGLLRDEVKSFLVGCDYIIHGGDIGNAGILEELGALAPVTAVRGNNDTGPWAARLRETELIRLGDIFVSVIHDLGKLEPSNAPVRVVVSGHSHTPRIDERGGCQPGQLRAAALSFAHQRR